MLYLLLRIDIELYDDSLVAFDELQVMLSKESVQKPVDDKPEALEPEPIQSEVIKPLPVEKLEVIAEATALKKTEKKLKEDDKAVSSPKPIDKSSTLQDKPKTPSSGDILNSFYSGESKNQELTDEFKVFSEPNMDFIYFEVEEPDWNKVVKMINEEIDKPRTQMKFYANGLEGKVERLMDKITIKKTFTTKYGTKITCGLVGVFAACSWK